MTECPVLEDVCSDRFDEDDPITFLFNKPEVALSYLRDAGLIEAGCVRFLIECQKKTNTQKCVYSVVGSIIITLLQIVCRVCQ